MLPVSIKHHLLLGEILNKAKGQTCFEPEEIFGVNRFLFFPIRKLDSNRQVIFVDILPHKDLNVIKMTTRKIYGL